VSGFKGQNPLIAALVDQFMPGRISNFYRVPELEITSWAAIKLHATEDFQAPLLNIGVARRTRQARISHALRAP
jgi:hypothetical protein